MDRLYLRPTGFTEAPLGKDGALQLAGGLCWFSAVEVISFDSARTGQMLVPVERLDAFLDALPENQRHDAAVTLARLTTPRAPSNLKTSTLSLDQPHVMAILNVTPDSFSDGGAHVGDPSGAAGTGMRMLAAGARLLDIGGESTRPGAQKVDDAEEADRVVPVIERLAAEGAAISIDTRKASVMAAALDAGAGLVNDVSALLYDPEALALVATRGCPVVLMHHQGGPEDMQRNPTYDDVLIEVYDWLEERIAACEAAGVSRTNILVDPGIGFGKTLKHNLALLNGLSLLHGLGCPIVLGASRKRFIGTLSNNAPVEQRLGGSVAVALLGATQGVQLLRVHDAFETAQALRVWRGLREGA
jgi:dihydropteroate synthase